MIRELADNLFTEIENKLAEIERLDVRGKHQEAFDTQLRAREKELEKKSVAIEDQNKDIAREKEFIGKALENIRKKEAIEARLDEKRSLLTELETKLRIEESNIDKKRAQLKDVEQRERDLDDRQALLSKKEEANLIRQDHLAAKEQSLLMEQQRLQRLAESWKVKPQV